LRIIGEARKGGEYHRTWGQKIFVPYPKVMVMTLATQVVGLQLLL
jgi:hypothetical protein